MKRERLDGAAINIWTRKLSGRVRIKPPCLDDACVDDHNTMCSCDGFELDMPDDRVIDVVDDYWNGYPISHDMISEYLEN